MNKRAISILSILQVAALCFGILFTAVFCRISGRFIETHLGDFPQPRGYVLACAFRDHGFWIMLIILGWAVAAAILSSRDDTVWFTDQVTLVSGGALFAILVFAGFWFSIMATTPFRIL